MSAKKLSDLRRLHESEHMTALRGLSARLDDTKDMAAWIREEMQLEARNAHEAGVPKVDIARAAGVSRPTLDKWLSDS